MTTDGSQGGSHQRKSVHRPEGVGARVHGASVRIFSAVLIGLGAVLLASTLAAGGGPLSVGVLLGLAFLAVGAGRLWAASRIGSRR
jgi:hypothetical protein